MKKVIILGGGVAGMSAAHELVERGFAVEVYDAHPNYCGGKARSVDVPDTTGNFPESALPGEHGFRFFPGFYKHIIDTMKRIPFKNADGTMNRHGVCDNLVSTEEIMIARNTNPPIFASASFPRNREELKVTIYDMVGGVDSGLTKEEIDFFGDKIWQLMTSCQERRENFYEKVGWWEFMEADRFSDMYRHLLVEGLTRTLVAAKAQTASTKTGGDIFLQLIFNMMDMFVNTDRVLNGPTNFKWLTPWLEYLKSKGALYSQNSKAVKLDIADGSITGAYVQDDKGNQTMVTGDYYLLAVPIEVAAPLINNNPDIIKADPTLSQLLPLAKNVQWMNGLQFFLNENVLINKGHVIYCDSQWAITSISQVQFWKDYDITKCYNGKVKGVLSVDISNWFEIGFNGKMASECTPEEIKDEVWLQLKAALNHTPNPQMGDKGGEQLRDDMVEYWYLDHDIEPGSMPAKINTNQEPLLVNSINTWCLRPTSYTCIPNLFLSGDYVRTFTDLATMEGANESARRAVNCIIDLAESKAPYCGIWNLHEPLFLAPLREMDALRWRNGLAWKCPWEDKHFLTRVVEDLKSIV